MIRLRVKHYASNKWVIQRRVCPLLWRTIRRAFVWPNFDPFMSSRRFPWMFDSIERAEAEAQRLAEPGALERHAVEQDAVWAAAQSKFKQFRRDRKRVIYFGSH